MTDAERAFTQWNDLNYIKDTDWGYTAFLAGYEAAIAASPSEEKVKALIEAAGAADKALSENTKAWLTVAPTLAHPYLDDPRWTPWTRFGERAARRAHDARSNLRRALAALRTTKEEE